MTANDHTRPAPDPERPPGARDAGPFMAEVARVVDRHRTGDGLDLSDLPVTVESLRRLTGRRDLADVFEYVHARWREVRVPDPEHAMAMAVLLFVAETLGVAVVAERRTEILSAAVSEEDLPVEVLAAVTAMSTHLLWGGGFDAAYVDRTAAELERPSAIVPVGSPGRAELDQVLVWSEIRRLEAQGGSLDQIAQALALCESRAPLDDDPQGIALHNAMLDMLRMQLAGLRGDVAGMRTSLAALADCAARWPETTLPHAMVLPHIERGRTWLGLLDETGSDQDRPERPVAELLDSARALTPWARALTLGEAGLRRLEPARQGRREHPATTELVDDTEKLLSEAVETLEMGVADQIVPLDNFAYLDWLWKHWTGSVPGFDSTEDREAGKAALRTPANVHAALGLYRDNFSPATFGTDQWEMGRLPAELPPQPTLYLHGSEEPLIDQAALDDLVKLLPAGSRGELLDGVGHFPLIEKPDTVNRLITEFLAR